MDEVIATSLGSCRSCSSWTICTSRRGTKEVIDYFSIRVTFFFCFIQDFLHFFRFIMGKHFFLYFLNHLIDELLSENGVEWVKNNRTKMRSKNISSKKLFFSENDFSSQFFISTQALKKWYKGKTWLFLALWFLEFWVRLPLVHLWSKVVVILRCDVSTGLMVSRYTRVWGTSFTECSQSPIKFRL